MVTAFDCPVSEDALEQYALGILAEAELAPLEEHLFLCRSCQDRLAEVDAFIRSTRQAARNLIAAPPSRWQEWWVRAGRFFHAPVPVWVGAMVVLALLLLWMAPPSPPVIPPPVTVLLQSARGAEGLAIQAAPAGKSLRLAWEAGELPAVPSYRVEVVDASGRTLHQRMVEPAEGTPALMVAPLARGQYWVRVHANSPQRELLREFGLRVE